MRRSIEEYERAVQEFMWQKKQRRRRLVDAILSKAENGGFAPRLAWDNEALQGYSYNEIVAACRSLEESGVVKWLPDGRYVALEKGEMC